MNDGKIKCRERDCGSNVAGWCQQETLPKDCIKVRDDREKLIHYAAELTVLLHGCYCQGCPFAKYVRGGIAAAMICNCGEKAKQLVGAIAEGIKSK